jgi:hypothetical protein
MSSVCTSILPDKVVFLITNNRENIEGSRQILRGIQKVKRLKNQKPIKVTLALTRIPFPQDDEERKNEQKMIEDIKGFLNEEVKNLDEQLNISDILVLHSDRSLELAESLRLNLENIKDKPLANDYLQLFSKNIPGKLIETKIKSILEGTISPENLFENPDKIEKELEALAFIYPHPQSFEKLIDFYFLRNKSIEEKLRLFLELWRVSKQFSTRMFSKFIKTFIELELDNYSWYKSNQFFIYIAGIAEEYFKANPNSANSVNVVLKLAGIYDKNSEYKTALDYYLKVIDKVEEKSNILKAVFKIYKNQKEYKSAHHLCDKYSDTIAANSDLKIPVLEIMYLENNRSAVKRLLTNDPGLEDLILDENPELYSQLMTMLGKEEKLNNKLLSKLSQELSTRSEYKLVDLGKIFFKLNKFKIFKENIPDDFPGKQYILSSVSREIF